MKINWRLLVLACLVLSWAISFAPSTASVDDPPLGYVIIPSIHLVRAFYLVPIIDHQYSDAALVGRVGWLQDTAGIEDNFGPMVLAGHSYGVFRDVSQIAIGDEIIVLDDQSGAAVYHVIRSEVVTVDNWQVLAYTPTPVLLLITCANDQRLVIYAERDK